MKKILLLVLVMAGYVISLSAQTGKVKPYQMYTTNYMKPKRGHEKHLRRGEGTRCKVSCNCAIYSRLSAITEGTGSDGWYIWTMGPLMYTDLDNQPDGKKDHDDDGC